MEKKYYGTGKRKNSVAKVTLTNGTGKITVNGKDVREYFPYEVNVMDLTQPLVLTNTNEIFDVDAKVVGGGFQGQTGAIRLGITRALLEYDQATKDSEEFLIMADVSRKKRKQVVDMMSAVVECLELQDIYDGAGIMLFVHWGQTAHDRSIPCCKTVYIQHGDGIGGKTIGGKMTGAQRRSDIVPDADVIICCHVHTPATWKEQYFRTDTRHDTVCKRERCYIVTGSALEYEGGYAEKFGLRPSALVFPMAVLAEKTTKVIM